MKIITKLLFLLALAATFFVSCKKDKEETPTPTNSTAISAPISGTVVDVYGNALVSVTVKAGTYTTTTDQFGAFYIPSVTFSTSRFSVSFEKTGYFSLHRSGIPQSGKPINLSVGLISETDYTYAGQISYTSTQADSITLPNGSIISFPANAFVKSDGSAFSGNVTVKACYLDPSWDDYGMFVFGGDLYGKDINNTDVMLNPFAGLNVVITDNSGNKLVLDSVHNKKATVKMLIPPAMQSIAPNNISLWEYNTNLCMASEKGSAVKYGDKYQGEVAHFSYWSCQKSFIGKATIYGYVKKLVGSDSVSVSGMKVRVGRQIVITDQDGRYEAKVPAGVDNIVVVPVFAGVAFNPYIFSTGLQDNQSYRVDFSIPSGNTVLLRGTVRSADGALLPNVCVSAEWYSTSQQKVITFTNNLGKFVLPVDATANYVTLIAKTATNSVTKYINYPTDTTNADMVMPATPGANKLTVNGSVIFNITGMPDGASISSYCSVPYMDIYVHVPNNGTFTIMSANASLPPMVNQTYAIPSDFKIQFGTQQMTDPDTLINGTIKFTKFNAVQGKLMEGVFSGTGSLGATVSGIFSVPYSSAKKKVNAK